MLKTWSMQQVYQQPEQHGKAKREWNIDKSDHKLVDESTTSISIEGMVCKENEP